MTAKAKARARGLRPRGQPPEASLATLAGWLLANHRGESVAALEGLAACALARLRAGRDLPGRPPRLSDDSADRFRSVARRIAGRALAGALVSPLGRARRLHRVGALPAWAVLREPLAEAGGFVFYGEEE